MYLLWATTQSDCSNFKPLWSGKTGPVKGTLVNGRKVS